MQTTTETKNASPFKRKQNGRIGMSILNLKNKVGTSNYLKIDGIGDFQTKEGKVLPYFNATNLETGEEGMVWIDGGMKGQFSRAGGVKTAVGRSFEFIWKGKEEFETEDGETAMVNKYDIFELDPT